MRMEDHDLGPREAQAVPPLPQREHARSQHRVREGARAASPGLLEREAAAARREAHPAPRPAGMTHWEDICAESDLVPGTGAAALVGGEQVAIVKTMRGDLYAISNFDPFSRAFVLARGIVGDRDGRPKIASP